MTDPVEARARSASASRARAAENGNPVCPVRRCDGRRQHLLVADASASVRAAMQAVLETEGWCVDAHPANAGDLLRRSELAPACVVIDHELPGGALLAIRRLTGLANPPPVILLCPRDDEDIALAAIRAGAKGVLPRSADTAAVTLAIETVVGGGVSLPAGLVVVLVREYQKAGQPAPHVGRASFPYRLSEREHRVLELLAQGMTTSQVAQALFVTTATVRSHVAGIVRGVGVSDRNAAVQRFATWTENSASMSDQLDAVSRGGGQG